MLSGSAPSGRDQQQQQQPQQSLDDSYLSLTDFIALSRLSHTNKQRHSPTSNDNLSSSIEDNDLMARNLANEFINLPEFYFMSEYARKAPLNIGSFGASNQQSSFITTSNVKLRSEQKESQFLTMPIDETLINTLNVLSLPNLNVQMFRESNLEFINDNFTTNAQQQPHQVKGFLGQIECEASNLHYDLRSLIHLFAPRSLFGQITSDLSSDFWSSSNLKQSNQLISSIQQALELGSKSSDSIPLVIHNSAASNEDAASIFAKPANSNGDNNKKQQQQHEFNIKTNITSNFLAYQVKRQHELAEKSLHWQQMRNLFFDSNKSMATQISRKLALDIYGKFSKDIRKIIIQ